MKRDHKLILGGALAGTAGCVLAMGAFALGAALAVSAWLLIDWAGRGC